jgi:hypothetical protein
VPTTKDTTEDAAKGFIKTGFICAECGSTRCYSGLPGLRIGHGEADGGLLFRGDDWFFGGFLSSRDTSVVLHSVCYLNEHLRG